MVCLGNKYMKFANAHLETEDILPCSATSSFRSDEGLTLKTTAFQIVHGGNSTFINSAGEAGIQI